jgi:hypothetical protein
MKVLIACEFSGRVRDAFATLGHDAWSCDVLDSEAPGQHIKGNVLDVLCRGWDLMIAHPPCTALTVAGNRWYANKPEIIREAVDFVLSLAGAPIDRIAIENPIGRLSTLWMKPNQIIQPWQFGHGETKATCLWLKGLPNLQPTDIVDGRTPRVHHEPPSVDRWKNRSRTLPGIAEAMAEQWSNL